MGARTGSTPICLPLPRRLLTTVVAPNPSSSSQEEVALSFPEISSRCSSVDTSWYSGWYSLSCKGHKPMHAVSFGASIRAQSLRGGSTKQGALAAPCLLTWVSKIKASRLLAAFSLSCFSRSRRVRSSSLWDEKAGIGGVGTGPFWITLHTCSSSTPASTYFCTERASSSSGKSGRSKTASSTPISSTIFCFRAGFCFFSSSGAGGTPSGPACPFSLGF